MSNLIEQFYTAFQNLNSEEFDAEFQFKDGKIIKHKDNFDLHRWAKQALGFKGWLLGGTSFFRKKLNQQTKKLLDKF